MPKITPQVSNIGQGREGVGHTIATTTTNITRVMPATFQVAIRSILHRFAQKMSGFASCFVFSNALTKAFVSRLWITWLKARKNADFADFGSFFVFFHFPPKAQLAPLCPQAWGVSGGRCRNNGLFGAGCVEYLIYIAAYAENHSPSQ